MKRLPTMVQWRLTLRWSNHYTKPPEGQPEVLCSVVMSQPKGKGAPRREEWPEAFREAADLSPPGNGYGLFISVDLVDAHTMRVQWSPERKGRVRLANMRARVSKQLGSLFPTLVEEAVRSKVEEWPQYYAGTER